MLHWTHRCAFRCLSIKCNFVSVVPVPSKMDPAMSKYSVAAFRERYNLVHSACGDETFGQGSKYITQV